MNLIYEVFFRLRKNYTLNEIKNFVKIEAPNQVVNSYACSSSTSPYDIIRDNNFYNINVERRQAKIIFTFLKSKLRIMSYGLESTINVNPSSCRWSYPISWQLYGSNDKNNWRQVHSVDKNNALSERGKIHWFNLPHYVTYTYYQFISTETSAETWQGISEFDFRGIFLNEVITYNKKTDYTCVLLLMLFNLVNIDTS